MNKSSHHSRTTICSRLHYLTEFFFVNVQFFGIVSSTVSWRKCFFKNSFLSFQKVVLKLYYLQLIDASVTLCRIGFDRFPCVDDSRLMQSIRVNTINTTTMPIRNLLHFDFFWASLSNMIGFSSDVFLKDLKKSCTIFPLDIL